MALGDFQEAMTNTVGLNSTYTSSPVDKEAVAELYSVINTGNRSYEPDEGDVKDESEEITDG